MPENELRPEALLSAMRRVLARDAGELEAEGEPLAGKSAATAIGEALARAGMKGDVKAVAILMELAGADYRSRDSEEKHLIDREKLSLGAIRPGQVIIEEARPDPDA